MDGSRVMDERTNERKKERKNERRSERMGGKREREREKDVRRNGNVSLPIKHFDKKTVVLSAPIVNQFLLPRAVQKQQWISWQQDEKIVL